MLVEVIWFALRAVYLLTCPYWGMPKAAVRVSQYAPEEKNIKACADRVW